MLVAFWSVGNQYRHPKFQTFRLENCLLLSFPPLVLLLSRKQSQHVCYIYQARDLKLVIGNNISSTCLIRSRRTTLDLRPCQCCIRFSQRHYEFLQLCSIPQYFDAYPAKEACVLLSYVPALWTLLSVITFQSPKRLSQTGFLALSRKIGFVCCKSSDALRTSHGVPVLHSLLLSSCTGCHP